MLLQMSDSDLKFVVGIFTGGDSLVLILSSIFVCVCSRLHLFWGGKPTIFEKICLGLVAVVFATGCFSLYAIVNSNSSFSTLRIIVTVTLLIVSPLVVYGSLFYPHVRKYILRTPSRIITSEPVDDHVASIYNISSSEGSPLSPVIKTASLSHPNEREFKEMVDAVRDEKQKVGIEPESRVSEAKLQGLPLVNVRSMRPWELILTSYRTETEYIKAIYLISDKENEISWSFDHPFHRADRWRENKNEELHIPLLPDVPRELRLLTFRSPENESNNSLYARIVFEKAKDVISERAIFVSNNQEATKVNSPIPATKAAKIPEVQSAIRAAEAMEVVREQVSKQTEANQRGVDKPEEKLSRRKKPNAPNAEKDREEAEYQRIKDEFEAIENRYSSVTLGLYPHYPRKGRTAYSWVSSNLNPSSFDRGEPIMYDQTITELLYILGATANLVKKVKNPPTGELNEEHKKYLFLVIENFRTRDLKPPVQAVISYCEKWHTMEVGQWKSWFEQAMQPLD